MSKLIWVREVIFLQLKEFKPQRQVMFVQIKCARLWLSGTSTVHKVSTQIQVTLQFTPNTNAKSVKLVKIALQYLIRPLLVRLITIQLSTNVRLVMCAHHKLLIPTWNLVLQAPTMPQQVNFPPSLLYHSVLLVNKAKHVLRVPV
jgi:hypothetical protein